MPTTIETVTVNVDGYPIIRGRAWGFEAYVSFDLEVYEERESNFGGIQDATFNKAEIHLVPMEPFPGEEGVVLKTEDAGVANLFVDVENCEYLAREMWP